MEINIAIAQLRPKKGDYAANIVRLGEVFAQLDALATQPDVLLLPETAMSGYFLEGGVREVARSREDLFADLLRVYRENTKNQIAILDIGVGFYELHEAK